MKGPLFEVECVDCEMESGARLSPHDADAWVNDHFSSTGHRRYLRITSEPLVLGEGSGRAVLRAVPEPPAGA